MKFETTDLLGLAPAEATEAQVIQISQFARGMTLQNTKDDRDDNLCVNTADSIILLVTVDDARSIKNRG